MIKPCKEYVRGIIETIVSDYQENIGKKSIQKIEVEECGELDFKVKIWYPVSESESDFDLNVIRPDHSIESIRKIVFNSLDLVSPFKISVTV